MDVSKCLANFLFFLAVVLHSCPNHTHKCELSSFAGKSSRCLAGKQVVLMMRSFHTFQISFTLAMQVLIFSLLCLSKAKFILELPKVFRDDLAENVTEKNFWLQWPEDTLTLRTGLLFPDRLLSWCWKLKANSIKTGHSAEKSTAAQPSCSGLASG